MVGFIPRLEAARGIAALVVAAFHAALAPWDGNRRLIYSAPDLDDPFWGTVSRVYQCLCNGPGAVYFFFVLSGFVLAVSLDRGPRNVWPSAHRFFIGRIFRLYPAVIFTVLLFAMAHLGHVPARILVPILLRNMALFDSSVVGVTWSLQVEMIAAPLIFAAMLIGRRWGHATVVLIAAFFVLLSFNGSWRDAFGSIPSRLGPLYCFLFGVLVGSVGREIVRRMNGPATCCLFTAAVLVFFTARPVLGYTSHWNIVAEAWAAATLVAIIVYGEAANFVRPLDWPLIRFYGRISYSFYLLHTLPLGVVWKSIPDHVVPLLEAGVPSVAVAFGLAVLLIAAATPIAWLSWRFVEVPGIALGRCLVRDETSVATS